MAKYVIVDMNNIIKGVGETQKDAWLDAASYGTDIDYCTAYEYESKKQCFPQERPSLNR